MVTASNLVGHPYRSMAEEIYFSSSLEPEGGHKGMYVSMYVHMYLYTCTYIQKYMHA
jgi:hypothetical protein